MSERRRRKRRRRLLWLGAISIVLLALGPAEYFASRAISAKLTAAANQKLDAELRLGRVLYLPPYGACIWDAELVRVGQPIVKISRAIVELSEFPLSDKPIIIARLTVSQPEFQLSPGAFRHIVKPGAENKHPRKLSGMLQLKQLRIHDARISYTDPSINAPPMVWDRITLEADTVQQSPSLYSVHLLSRAYPLLDANAAGSID